MRRAGGGAADLGDRKPLLARQRRGRVEPEAAAAGRDPVCPVRAAPLRDAVREGESDAGPQSSLPFRRESELRTGGDALDPRLRGRGSELSHLLASPRAASARLPRSLRQRRSRSSRSASFPPSPRSDSSTAASAADLAPAARLGLDQHVGEARRQRQSGDRLAVRRSGGRPRRSRRATSSRLRASSIAAAGGGSSQASSRGSATPQMRAIEQQGAEIGLQDLGRVEARQARSRRFLPEPIDDSRRLPPGPAGALGDRGLARPLGDQPGDPGAAIVARPPGEAAIDDDPDSVEGQAGLGDRGGEHELAPARRRRRRSPRAARPDRGCRGAGGGRRRRAAGRAARRSARSRRRRAGRRAGSPSASPSARRIAAAISSSIRFSAERPIWRSSIGWLRPSLSIAGAPPISAAKRAPSRVADIATSRRSGRSARLRVERQSEAEIAVEAALVHFVEQHRRDALELRIGLDPVAEYALGQDQDPGRRRSLAVEPRRIADRRRRPLSPASSAIRSAAARAASRRGESSKISPAHQGSPSKAGATAVVLPAPGGATSTAFGPAREGGEQIRKDGDGWEARSHVRPSRMAKALSASALPDCRVSQAERLQCAGSGSCFAGGFGTEGCLQRMWPGARSLLEQWQRSIAVRDADAAARLRASDYAMTPAGRSVLAAMPRSPGSWRATRLCRPPAPGDRDRGERGGGRNSRRHRRALRLRIGGDHLPLDAQPEEERRYLARAQIGRGVRRTRPNRKRRRETKMRSPEARAGWPAGSSGW